MLSLPLTDSRGVQRALTQSLLRMMPPDDTDGHGDHLPPQPGGHPARVEARAWQVVLRLRDRATNASASSRRWAMVVAFVGFVVAAVLSATNFPETEGPIAWHLILIGTVVGAPLSVLLNAFEYRSTAKSIGHNVDLWTALRVTVLGSAANMLPLPGSALVRMQAMTAMGSTARSAGAASLMAGLVWVGATITLAGAAQIVVGGAVSAGAAVTALGTAITAAGLVLLRRRGAAVFWSVGPALVLIEVLFVALAALRLYLILRGLRVDVGAADALGLTVAAAVATAAGIAPAGLGLREALTGGISPLVGIPAAAGIGAAVVDRIARMVLLAILASVFMITSRGSRHRGGEVSPRGTETPEGEGCAVRPDAASDAKDQASSAV